MRFDRGRARSRERRVDTAMRRRARRDTQARVSGRQWTNSDAPKP